MLSHLPRSSARAERLLYLGSLLGMLAIITLVAFLLAREHSLARASAIRAAYNVAQLIDNEVQGNVEQYDHALQGVIRAVEHPDFALVPQALRRPLLFGQALATPPHGDMLWLDVAGDIVGDSLADPPRRANFASWASFTYLRDHDDRSLRISQPFRDSIGNLGWCISFSRRINDAQGQFSGVVSGALRLDYFSALFHSLSMGQDSSISLISDDGYILAREPALTGEHAMGQNFGKRQGMQPFLVEAASGSVVQVSGLDGKERLYTYVKVGTLPLKVVIGVSTDQVYGPWRRTATMVCAATTVLCLGIFGFALMLCRELNKRQRAERTLAALALTDGLTGLANRRRLDHAIGHEWQRAQRNRLCMAVLMIDVDHFKTFNERYGHPGGDAALRAVARTIAQCIQRRGDLAARYGGEEFAVLLTHTDLAGALTLAETIRAAVECSPAARQGLGKVTVSIGASAARGRPNCSIDTLLCSADEALYRAKAQGRNCIAGLDAGHATDEKKSRHKPAQ